MKTNLSYLLAILSFLSCTKSNEVPITGDFECLKNGKIWTGCVAPNILENGDISLSFDHYNEAGENQKSIVIVHFPRQEGVLELEQFLFTEFNTNPFTYYSVASVFDVAGDVYRLVENDSDNHFEVTSYNKRNGKMEGTFSLTYEYDDRYGESVESIESDSIISFTEGHFSFKLKE